MSTAADTSATTPLTSGSASPPLLWPVAVFAFAAVLYVVAHPLARRLGAHLPKAATVSSAGTRFPGLGDALGFELRALAIVTVVVALVALIPRIRDAAWRDAPSVTRIGLPLVVLGAALFYARLGYPHNGFPSNARIHWVDIYYDRANSFHYTLPKLPHRFFYDAPYLLQALNGALNAVLVYAIGRALSLRRWVALAMAAALIGSSLLLAFADTAEDVQLNVAALLFAALAYARRWTPWLGVSLLLAVLGRPQFVLVWFAVVVAEILVVPDGESRSPGARLRSAVANRFLVVNLAVAVAAFAVWDAYLVSRHSNWFLHDGKLIDAPFTEVVPKVVDGFRISRFSGAFVLHALWIFPVVYLLATVVSAISFRHLPLGSRRFAVFAWTVVAGGLFVSEDQPLAYFNVRYIAYLWPFFLISAWVVLDAPMTKRIGTGTAVAALSLSVLTPYWQFVDTRERMTRQPVARLFDDRGELRRLVGDGSVATTSDARGVRNYLSYLFKRPFDEIQAYAPDSGRVPDYVVALASEDVPGRIVLRDGPVVVVSTP